MGYLIVAVGTFVVALVVTAVLLALVGVPPDWDLIASLILAFMVSGIATRWYEGDGCAPH